MARQPSDRLARTRMWPSRRKEGVRTAKARATPRRRRTPRSTRTDMTTPVRLGQCRDGARAAWITAGPEIRARQHVHSLVHAPYIHTTDVHTAQYGPYERSVETRSIASAQRIRGSDCQGAPGQETDKDETGDTLASCGWPISSSSVIWHQATCESGQTMAFIWR